MLDETFSKNEVAAFLGDQNVSTSLLELPFDHIFFTGSTAVGKIVMRAASQNLSSVTLELGGKSPLIVDATADLKWTAERLLWGKWINAGQSCVAPDILFIDRHIWLQLQDEIKKAGIQMCKNWKSDFSQIISPRHFERLLKIAEISPGWRLAIQVGEDANRDDRRLPIQFYEELDQSKTKESSLCREEIFGPISGVILYDNISEALEKISQMDKPLSLYLFSTCKKTQDRFTKETSSGSLVFNDVLVQLTNPSLPFGGVGPSGVGSYHGEHGFRTFSHEKAVLWQGGAKALARFFSPPYSSTKFIWAKRILSFFS